MLDKAKMLAQAYRLKVAIEAEEVEVGENGIKVKVGGNLKLRSLSINGIENSSLVDIVNKGIRKAQEVAASKMKEMGGLDELV